MFTSNEFLPEYINLYAYEIMFHPSLLSNAIKICLGFKPIDTLYLFVYGDTLDERDNLIYYNTVF